MRKDKKQKYANLGFPYVYDLYERYQNLKEQNRLNSRQKKDLEDIIEVLRNYDFNVRRSEYLRLRNIARILKEEGSKLATKYRGIAEEFKARFLD